MIEREHDRLSVSRQCQLVGLSRSTWYYRAVGESAETLALMQRIDQLYLLSTYPQARSPPPRTLPPLPPPDFRPGGAG